MTGSSRGLGSAIARRLGRDDLAVAVNGLHGDARALEVVDAIRDGGGVADVFAADVTDGRQVNELVRQQGFVTGQRLVVDDSRVLGGRLRRHPRASNERSARF